MASNRKSSRSRRRSQAIIENGKQDLHKFDIWLAEAKAEQQELLIHSSKPVVLTVCKGS